MNDNTTKPSNGEVVSLFGGPVPEVQGEADQELVEELERLLAQARSGAVIGVAFVATHSDLATQSGWVGSIERLSSPGEIDILRHRVIASVIDEHDGAT